MKIKTTVIFLASIVIALLVILLLKPLVDNYKNKSKYDFTISSFDGELTKESFDGKVLAIYFGYMSCPDVCPTSLSTLSMVLKSFSKKQIKQFKGLFISVDSNRDTLKNLKEYAQYFHPNFLGATSSKKNIDDIIKRYDSFYKNIYLENSAINYSISHTSYIYIFDKEGKFVAKIDHFANPEKIQEVLEKIL